MQTQWKTIIIFISLCSSIISLNARTCPSPERVRPTVLGYWAASGWHSESPATAPHFYQLNFHEVVLMSAQPDNSFLHVYCTYNDALSSNGLVTLVPNSNRTYFPPKSPANHLWSFGTNGLMAHCEASARDCVFQ